MVLVVFRRRTRIGIEDLLEREKRKKREGRRGVRSVEIKGTWSLQLRTYLRYVIEGNPIAGKEDRTDLETMATCEFWIRHLLFPMF